MNSRLFQSVAAALLLGTFAAGTLKAQLIITPGSVAASYQLGSSNVPAPVSLTIASTPNVTLSGILPNFGTAQQQNWFSLTPTPLPTSTPAAINVNFSPANLPVGHYTAAINVISGNTSQTIPVTLDVTQTATLSYSPAGTVALTGSTTGNSVQTQLTVSSSGLPIAFTAAATGTAQGTAGTVSWLSVTQTGTATGGANNLTITANPTGLGPGTYSGTVTLSYPNNVPSPISIPVTFTVSAPAGLAVSPATLNFAYETGRAVPAAQMVNVTNGGGSALNFTTTVSTPGTTASWLIVSPSSGTTPAALSVSVSPAGLAAGSYTGTITITPQAGSQQPVATLTVNLTVGSTSLLMVTPNQLVFNTQAGSNPQPQGVTVTSTSGVVAYNIAATTSASGANISLSNLNGAAVTATPLAPSFFVGWNAANLPVGVYTGSVSITPQTGGPATTIPVTLNVTAAAALTVTPNALTFSVTNGGNPASQTVTVASTDGTAQAFTATATTADQGNWLTVTPASGTTSVAGATAAQVTVAVNSANLATGSYTGQVVIGPAGQPALQTTISVSLTVTGAVTFTAAPTSLTFNQPNPAVAPATQTVTLTSVPANSTFAAAATTTTGSTWLSVTPTSGTTGTAGATLTVTANGSALAQGTYTGAINITPSGATNPTPIPVTLTVGATATLSVSPANLTFTGQVGQTTPPATQTINVTSATAGTAVNFSVTQTTNNGGNTWLTSTISNGVTPGAVTVGVNPTGLAAGTYTGTITITPSGTGAGAPQTVSVTLTLTGPAPPSVLTVQNAASLLPGPLAPGEIITIKGSGLGPATGLSFTPTAAGNVDTSLSGVTVLFDNNPAPILYASQSQINAIVPYTVYGRLSTSLQVQYQNQSSTAVLYSVATTAPGIFTISASGSGQGAILNEDNTVNGPNAPAVKGHYIVIYATGEGQTDPTGADGHINTTTLDLKKPLQPVAVNIAGQDIAASDIAYAGSAPQLVSGGMQINVKLPLSAPSGPQPVIVRVGGNPSQSGVTVVIR